MSNFTLLVMTTIVLSLGFLLCWVVSILRQGKAVGLSLPRPLRPAPAPWVRMATRVKTCVAALVYGGG